MLAPCRVGEQRLCWGLLRSLHTDLLVLMARAFVSGSPVEAKRKFLWIFLSFLCNRYCPLWVPSPLEIAQALQGHIRGGNLALHSELAGVNEMQQFKRSD